MIHDVELSRLAQKQLLNLPHHVVSKLKAWIDAVQVEGLEEVRKIRGYHDEALHGKRRGERSIRLSRAYRAIYTIKQRHIVECAVIEEVHNHDY